MASKKETIYLRVEGRLKERLEHQCERLGMDMNAFSRMALTKLIEEEEQIEDNKAKRA